MCMVLFFLFYFFFQAEDGIRDLTVTGVQTCALPISLPFVIDAFLMRAADDAIGHEMTLSTPCSAINSRTSSMTSGRSEEHTSELQSQSNLVCRLLLEKKKKKTKKNTTHYKSKHITLI